MDIEFRSIESRCQWLGPRVSVLRPKHMPKLSEETVEELRGAVEKAFKGLPKGRIVVVDATTYGYSKQPRKIRNGQQNPLDK